LIRVGLPVPANAEFELVAVDDPYGYAHAGDLSLFRRPLPSTNLRFLSTVMWDGRETFTDPTSTNCILGTTACFASIHFDLSDQATGATTGHAQAPEPTAEQREAIVAFETSLFTGSHVQHQGKTRDRYQLEASSTFFPERKFGGQHDFKTGVSVYWDRTSDAWLNNEASDGPYGNYVLITDKINGVSGTPFRIRAYNTPVFPQDNEDIFAWYFKDSWRPTDKLTFNLGLRWEYQHSYLPEQDYAGARDFATVFPAKHVDFLDVQTFNRVVPRLGVAYDLGGKSVVKATWGLYNYILGDTYGDVFAATATANAVFLWHDLNNDLKWTPNETNLALNNNPDFVSITAASNYELSPELKQPDTWESTVSFERELAPSLGIRVMYINRIVNGSLETINAKRPYEAYNIPITRRDPGPDGDARRGADRPLSPAPTRGH